MATANPTGPRVLHAGWRLALFLLLVTLLAAGVGLLFFLSGYPPQRSHGVLQPVPLLGSAIAVVLVIVGATLLSLGLVERRSLATIGLPSGRVRNVSLAAGLLLGAIVPLLVCGLLWVAGNAVITANTLSASDLLRVTLPMVAATLLLSSWEEIAFRGYGMQLATELGGRWLGAGVTGVAFGLAHAGNPGANLLGFLNTALNGVLLGWLVIRTGSLWLSCGYHAGWNLAASTLLGMRDSGTIAPGSFFSTSLTGPTWLSGGTYGFEASALSGIAETVLLVGLLAVVPRVLSVPEALPWFAGARPRPTAATV
jgi:membrane protease YdiL (CAAX protease family)